MWNWLVSNLAARRDGHHVRRRAHRARPNDPLGPRRAGAARGVRHERQVARARREGGAGAGRRARPVGAADHPVHGKPARRAQLRLRLPAGEGATSASAASAAAPTSSPASRWRARRCRCIAARSRCAATAMKVDVFDERGRPFAGERASSCARRPSRACRWRSGTTPTAAGTARRTSTSTRHVAARRLGGADGARRHDHPWPQRRHAQPRRRAHRHGRDLPPGGAAARRSWRAS